MPTTILDPNKFFSVETYVGNAAGLRVGNSFGTNPNPTYDVARSLRFNSTEGHFLTRTHIAGDRKKWTFSAWVKRSNTGTAYLFGSGTGGTNTYILFDSSDRLSVVLNNTTVRTTTRVIRDPEWHHIVVALDAFTNSIAVYIDNTEITSFATSVAITNTNYEINNASVHYLGSAQGSSSHFNGYLADVNFVDGFALTPSSFGELDSVYGRWVPKSFTGSGNNTVRLTFSNNSSVASLGLDSSGLGNRDWTPQGSFSVSTDTDSVFDTPTNQHPIIDVGHNSLGTSSVLTISNGGLRVAHTGINQSSVQLSFQKLDTRFLNQTYQIEVGIETVGTRTVISHRLPLLIIASDGSGLLTNTFTSGDILQFTFNATTTSVYKNGVLLGTFAEPIDSFVMGFNGSCITNINAGQQPFQFPIAGAVAFSSKNIVFDKFQPDVDLVIIKNNDATSDWVWVDSVRPKTGSGWSVLASNNQNQASTEHSTIHLLGKGQVEVGSDSKVNGSRQFHTAVMFKGALPPVSNTQGTIASTVAANVLAGFSIVTYTGTSAGGTIGHGLGKRPKFIITRVIDDNGGYQWYIWHDELSSDNHHLEFNVNAENNSGVWGAGTFSSTVYSVGSNLSLMGKKFISYVFTEVPGFSKFGKYVGNFSIDGPYIDLGMTASCVFIKSTSGTDRGWKIVPRILTSNANPASYGMMLNSSVPGSNDAPIDFLSSGLKIRGGSPYTAINADGATFVYAAFATSPFSLSNAR